MKSKLLTILLSLVIAFVMWAYVITYEYTQMEYTYTNIEVQMLGVSTLNDRNLMLASGSEYTVDLTIVGKRSDISRLRSSDITVTANLGSIYEAGQREISYEVSFPGDIGNGAIEIVKRSPEMVKINIVEKTETDIPVKVEFTGQLPEGYVAGEEVLSHTSVHLSGPVEWLNKIKKGVVTVDLTGRTETYEDVLRLQLCDAEGNRVDTGDDDDMKSVVVSNSQILVKIPILMRKEIQLRLPIIPGGGLTQEDVSLNMSAERITVIGSPSVISGLPDSVELGTIDLAQESEGFTDREYQIPLSGSFTVEGNQSMKVKVTLTMPKMVEKSIDIAASQIEFVGVPKGYTASATSKLTVTIRCMEEDADRVKATDLRAIVDLDGAVKDGYFSVRIEAKAGVDVGIASAGEQIWIDLSEVAD